MSNPLIGQQGVTYGLQIKKTNKPNVAAIFAADDEEDDNTETEAEFRRRKLQEQAQASQAKPIPSNNTYDEDYDAVKKQQLRNDPKMRKYLGQAEAPQSKYISSLLEKSDERKKIMELAYERKLRRTEDAERELYGDTEKFITEEYKQKLEENRQWEAEQRLKEEEKDKSSMGSGSSNMQSFYQNMLNNVSGDTSAKTEKKVANVEPQPKEEAPKADAPYVSKKQREELYRQEQDKKRAEAIVQSLKRPRVEPDEFKKAVTKVAKRNDEESIAAARQRYLERKKLKGVC